MDYGYHVPGVMCAVPVPLQVGFYAIRYLKPESALGLHPHLRPGQSICELRKTLNPGGRVRGWG